ncbi:MAG: hypothetical protein WC734_03235 [Patescibacteria group bacterium]|jgi:hypothetical protein
MKQECVFTVTVNYDLTLEEMIATGRYDWKNGDITADHFLVRGGGQAEIEIIIVHFGRDMRTEDVLREIDARGFCAATLPELLALGVAKPELQRLFPIVALGSVWRSPCHSLHVACLDSGNAKRGLRLRWYENDWFDNYRFAVVRKTTS